MASSYIVAKELSKLASRPLHHRVFVRGFQTNSKALAAQNFTMPAMSPTMIEGNIASWKVKEGDSFTTGDVLLEIETDKAQMDVEAQDDGKMAKITQQAGAKGVKVGTRIAVLAEKDDDLSSLYIAAEESAPTSSPQDTLRSGIDPSHSSESQAEAPPSSKSEDRPPMKASNAKAPQHASGEPQKQTYPLYPSIVQLLHEKGIPASEADKIPASGPKGRLLKGDVLAYFGTISSSYSSDQSIRISKLGHLDLSNVKPAPPKEIPTLPQSKAQFPQAAGPELPDTEIAVPISLSSVLSVQKRIQTTIGVTLPLSRFIARATELANHDLPRSTAASPTADDLFNDVLGLNEVSSKTSRGRYIPRMTALPNKPFTERQMPQRQPDVYDILAGNPFSSKASNNPGLSPSGLMAESKPACATTVFRVSASRGEEKRARVFLERVKTILQVEPGRLIL